MTLWKLTRIATFVIVLPAALAAVLIGVLSYLDISIPLERARQAFITSAREMTGRTVHIDGEVRLAISFFPTLAVDRLRIANTGDWQSDDLLTIGQARVQVALLPILSGRLKFQQIAAQGVILNLEQNAAGDNNWISGTTGRQPRQDPGIVTRAETRKTTWERVSIDEFSLTDVTIHYKEAKLDREFTDHVDKLQINTRDRSRLAVTFTGRTEGIPYSFTASSDLLRNLPGRKPWHIDARGNIGGHPVELKARLATADDKLAGTVNLNAQEVDIGKTLGWLAVTDGLDMAASRLQVSADLKGNSLNDLVRQSTFRVRLNDGKWNLHSPVDQRFRTISFEEASLSAIESQDISFEFSGRIDTEPISLVLHTGPLGALFEGDEKINLSLMARLAEADLDLHGDVSLPLDRKTFSIDMAVHGKQLDRWNLLLASKLPPLGPYSLTGRFDVSPGGYHVSALKAVIGDSDLGGSIDVDITGNRPLWQASLVSNQFQIDDFVSDSYSLIPHHNAGTGNANEETGSREMVGEALARADNSLDQPNVSNVLDANIELEAKHVYSGPDRLGDGKLVMRIRENALNIDTVHLNIPGGDVNGAMGVGLADKGIEGYFRLDMEKFDYGILVRRMVPQSKADGLITAHVDLQLAGPDYSHGFENANGKIDFAAWPRNIGADVLNIWAVNLYLAILPSFSDKESKVNCLVAVLDTEQGQLKEEFLAIDTTKVWVNGNLDVSFPDQTVKLSLFPQSKTARMFSLQTPIRVAGNFDQMRLKIQPLDLIGAYASFVLSPLHAPMRRIFGNKVPQDGSEMCGKLLDRDYLEMLKQKRKEEEEALDNAYSGD